MQTLVVESCWIDTLPDVYNCRKTALVISIEFRRDSIPAGVFERKNSISGGIHGHSAGWPGVDILVLNFLRPS